MLSGSRTCLTALTSLLALTSPVSPHLLLTYPGWRGNSLDTTGYVNQTNGMNGVVSTHGGSSDLLYPFGQQWAYPCGGSPLTTNRTLWPVTGGAVSFEPGWFTGHLFGLVYVNLGIGTNPANMSNVMVPPFQIAGPSNDAYPGLGVCLPQVPLPANYAARIGENATIQVVLSAQHGASLYSCVDITFADPKDVAQVNKTNCYNSTEIGFNMVVTTRSLTTSAAPPSLKFVGSRAASYLAGVPLLLALAAGALW